MIHVSDKIEYFESIFPYPLESMEWKIKLPIVHKSGKTYNPDYFCKELDCLIELCTSEAGYMGERIKWREAIDRFGVRVFWWTGHEMTNSVNVDFFREAAGLPLGHDYYFAPKSPFRIMPKVNISREKLPPMEPIAKTESELKRFKLIGALGRKRNTKAQAQASRTNGAKGGRPVTKKV